MKLIIKRQRLFLTMTVFTLISLAVLLQLAAGGVQSELVFNVLHDTKDE